MSRRAVFLDRDGVLNAIVRRGEVVSSPRTLDELQIEPDAPAALGRLRDAGFRLFVVTNQPDVRRGKMTAAALEAIHQRLAAALPVEAISACLHDTADNCACRKPRPGLLLDLASRLDLDLAASWMVGDQDRDVACGRAAGVGTVLLARDYNSGARANADATTSTLSQAVDAILSVDG
jgi:D-glycero-D-manno-heptose 1,7-bisphosphate phosphatase